MKTIGQISMLVKKTVLEKEGEKKKLNHNMTSHFQYCAQTLSLSQKRLCATWKPKMEKGNKMTKQVAPYV